MWLDGDSPSTDGLAGRRSVGASHSPTVSHQRQCYSNDPAAGTLPTASEGLLHHILWSLFIL